MPETSVRCLDSLVPDQGEMSSEMLNVPCLCRADTTMRPLPLCAFPGVLMQVLSTSTAPDFIAHPLEGKLPTVRKRKAPAETTSDQKDDTKGKKRRKRGKRTGLLAEEATLFIGNREEERKLAREQVCADTGVVRLRKCRPQKALLDSRPTSLSRHAYLGLVLTVPLM